MLVRMEETKDSSIRRFTLILTLFASGYTVTVYGETAPPAEKAGHLEIGPEIKLTDSRALTIRAVMNGEGQVHIVLTTMRPKGLHYIVIGPEGVRKRDFMKFVKKRDLLKLAVIPASLDVAFDKSGRLHLLAISDANDESAMGWHMIRKSDSWKESYHTP
jgi:hypothetical protein